MLRLLLVLLLYPLSLQAAETPIIEGKPISVKDGDIEGQAVWRRILAAVDGLVSTDRPEGAGVH
jgi:hypothetical protein